jgi:hypothetical protein
LYFDIFDFPLRLPEIYQFLPSNSVALKDLRAATFSHPLRSQISQKDEYYFLKGRSETLVENRREKERRARRLWSIARIMSHVISAFPFVRAVFVSGELSKGVASKSSDIDFFIVTSVNRVWVVRTLCATFKRIFLFNQKKFFCYNHIVSEQKLEVAERNIYTATEIVTLKPLTNNNLFDEVLQENSWTKEFLPNWQFPNPVLPKSPATRPIIERIISVLIRPKTLDAMDYWFMTKWRRAWISRYPSLTPAKRSELFQCTTDISTSYVKDFFTRIMLQYEQRLRRYGFSLDTAPRMTLSKTFKSRSASPSM